MAESIVNGEQVLQHVCDGLHAGTHAAVRGETAPQPLADLPAGKLYVRIICTGTAHNAQQADKVNTANKHDKNIIYYSSICTPHFLTTNKRHLSGERNTSLIVNMTGHFEGRKTSPRAFNFRSD